jgi:hypothetical protein
MFKITQDTIHRFSLAELLLIVAINQMDGKQKHSVARDGAKVLQRPWR